VTASCQHGIIYGFKVLLRGESVRDHVDLLLSLKHMPNIVINDMPGMTAKHGNHRQTNLFHPFEGRFAENTDINIERLKNGTLEVSLPFLQQLYTTQKAAVSTELSIQSTNVHPVTKASEVYCAVDRFHSKNIKTDADKLRDVKIVKELCGHVNSQVQEQFFSQLRKDIYFLNSLSPAKFMSLLRLILHFHNVELRRQQMQRVERLLGCTGLQLQFGEDGRLCSSLPSTYQLSSNNVDATSGNDNFIPLNTTTLHSPTTIDLQNDSFDSEATVSAVDEDCDIEETERVNAYDMPLIQTHTVTRVPHWNMVYRQFGVAAEHSTRVVSLVSSFRDIVDNAFRIFDTLTDVEQHNIMKNVIEISKLLSCTVSAERQNEVKTVVGGNEIVFQSQGTSNYCGLCCLNNIFGQNSSGTYNFTIQHMDDVADRLLLQLISDRNVGLACEISPFRDIEGYYSYEVLQKCINLHGYELFHVNPDQCQKMTVNEFANHVRLLLLDCCGKIIVRQSGHEHWLGVVVDDEERMLVYDSRKPAVVIMNFDSGCCYLHEQLVQSATTRGSVCFLRQSLPQIEHSYCQQLSSPVNV